MTKRLKKILTICFIILITVAIGIWVGYHFFVRGVFMYAGTLETTKVVLAARVASDVSDVYVNEGDTIIQGQDLMQLSCDVYKVLAKQIDNDFERANALVERGHLSVAEFDMLSRNKNDNDLKLSWCQIKSPIDGMVITKFREVGEIVAPGAMLISVANPYDIWAYFYVPHDVLYKLDVGQHVVGILPEVPDMQFNGKIIKINESAEFTPKNVQTRAERTRLVYGVKVQFENPDLILKSGMTIESALLND